MVKACTCTKTEGCFSKVSDVHAVLRRSKCNQPTPLAQLMWDAYLTAHLPPREAVQLARGSVALSAIDMTVLLGHRRDVGALLRQDAQNDWVPEPDVVSAPFEVAMQGLVAEQFKKMNGSASPGFDCVAPLFIKYTVVVRPWANGRGTQRVNVLVSYIGRLFKYPRWLHA